jgi:alpha-acetolactate decarboxylase
MKRILIISIIFVGCTQREPTTVRISGVLKSIMMENKTEASIDLNELKDEANLYALGAVAGLEGEILVLDSKPLITKVVGDTFSISTDFNSKAALLVYANVKDWNSQTMESIQSLKELEARLKQIAEDNKVTGAFPFMIKGNVSKLNWHIVNGNTGGSHESHVSSGYQGKLENSEVEIVGFYSEAHQGVFTHRGQFSHSHFKTKEGAAGHVDGLVIEKESLLFVPKSF